MSRKERDICDCQRICVSFLVILRCARALCFDGESGAEHRIEDMDGELLTHRERRSGSGKGRDREALDHVAARRDRRQLERRREDEHHAESEEAEHGCRGEVQAWATAETKSEMRRRAATWGLKCSRRRH